MRRTAKFLILALWGTGLVGCGGSGGGDLSFQDLCDQGATLMCERASSCGSSVAKADCIAQGKALNCPGGVEQYCGVGLTFQASKAPTCLDALKALTCTTLDTEPAACTPDVLCGSSGPSTPPQQGEACHVLDALYECSATASLCYGAGSVSSCPSRALCVGDSKGLYCASACTSDSDCLSAGQGLVCMQGCAAAILNGFCVKPSAKSSFLQKVCPGESSATSGISGWAL